MTERRALFLDRDGVINVDHGYVHRQEDFEFVEGIFELVAYARTLGYLVIIVTNQAGIGRGYYSEEDFLRLMDWVGTVFAARSGGVDKVFFCPHHPEHGVGHYRQDSHFRKPAPGMLLSAIQEFGINPATSVLVGDKPSDIAAGRAAGVGTNLLLGGEVCDGAIAVDKLSQVLPYLSAYH